MFEFDYIQEIIDQSENKTLEDVRREIMNEIDESNCIGGPAFEFMVKKGYLNPPKKRNITDTNIKISIKQRQNYVVSENMYIPLKDLKNNTHDDAKKVKELRAKAKIRDREKYKARSKK